MAMPNGMTTDLQNLALVEGMKSGNGGDTYVKGAVATSKPVEVGSERGKVTPLDWAKTLEELEADIDSQRGLRKRLDEIGERGRKR